MEVNSKRIELKALIKERKKVLKDLGIKLAVDPFDRIKIDEQLEIIELLGKNLRDVLLVKEKIKDNFSIVDGINAKNKELYLKISQKVELFNDRKSLSSTIGDVDVAVEHNQIDERKVISVHDISDGLNLNLVREKTNGVINRVYELFNDAPVNIKNEEVVPKLVIERESIFTDESQSQEIFEDSKLQDNNIFSDELDTQAIFNDNQSENTMSSDLFSEVEPFKETVLFTNKYDDVFAGDNRKDVVESKDIEMPELFFETEQQVFDDNNEEENNDELSLDEQIKALKLVA